MKMRAIQFMVPLTVLLTAGTGCAQTGASPELEPTHASQGTTGQVVEAAAPQSTEELPPPTTRPQPAPSALEVTTAAPPAVNINSALDGVIRQLRAGVDETVLLNFISRSTNLFNVGSEEIIYLTDLGAAGQVINAMIERDQQLQSPQSPTQQSVEPWPPAGTVAQVPAATSAAEAGAAPPAPEGEPVVIEPPAAEVSVDYFQSYLGPYGTWVNIPEYGLCWQPSVSVTTTGWRPYGDRGRWVYTNYGWYWYSDYSWGWATFHYGRWHYANNWGWCWVPGTVWGPSWVSWRYADAYCGWAPLPPYTRSGFYFSVGISWGIPSWCYTYVPAYNVCTYYPRQYAVPYAEARSIHGRARAYDNYAVGRNNTIHNRGIPPETLANNSGAEIRRAQVQERSEAPAGSGRRERMENDGQTLSVYQPGGTPTARTESAQPRVRNEARTASPNRTEVTGYNATSGTRPVESTYRTQSRTTPTPVQRSTPASTDQNRTATTATTRSLTRDEATSRDRTIGRTVQDSSPSQSPASTIQRNTNPSQEPGRQDSSLVIIGRQDSRAATATATPSRNAVSSSPASSPRPTSSAPLGSSRAEPSAVIQRTAPTTPTPTISRSTPTFSTRSSTLNRTVPSSSQFRTQPTPRSSYTAPATRSTFPSTPSRTFTAPSQPVRSAPVVRTAPSASPMPRSAPTYSPPSAPSRSVPQAPTRSAPPSRSGGPSGGRTR